jgi:hypothetical protein
MDNTTLSKTSDVGEAQQTAINVLNSAFDNLGKGAAVKGDAPRLFFPQGIELISISVKVGAVEITLEVAGAAGIKKTLDVSQPSSTPQLAA